VLKNRSVLFQLKRVKKYLIEIPNIYLVINQRKDELE